MSWDKKIMSIPLCSPNEWKAFFEGIEAKENAEISHWKVGRADGEFQKAGKWKAAHVDVKTIQATIIFVSEVVD